jgi:glycosyltransferase involved in cell wall biosynthesis
VTAAGGMPSASDTDRPSPVVVVIPAYNPSPRLRATLEQLAETGLNRVVVVDDGSASPAQAVFAEVGRSGLATVLRHAVNLGKGAALKTAFNHTLVTCGPETPIVTMDADGQHASKDVLAVAQALTAHPDSVVLGVRQFEGSVPFRSRLGNTLTQALVRLLVGLSVSDTQTGLRGIPGRVALRLLGVTASRYDFELDMLILCKHLKVPVLQVPIETIYLDGNASSHFSPLTDSLRVYWVLCRFFAASLVSAVLDNMLFVVAQTQGASPLRSQIAARLVALFVNYALLRKFVFFSDQRHALVFPKYLAVVALFGLVSYSAIMRLATVLPLSPLGAKLLVESVLFPVSFIVQRELVFRRVSS